MKAENFNIIITGYGGQGILTLADIIARAAFLSGLDVKQAELHGLAQRGGSLQIHVRFDKKVFSPLVMKGQADLIVALDALEALRACEFANKNTKIITNKKVFRIDNLDKILDKLKKHARVEIVDADKISKDITGKLDYSNTFILGYAVSRKFLPLKKENVWKALKERIRKEFLDDNKKVFDAGFK